MQPNSLCLRSVAVFGSERKRVKSKHGRNGLRSPAQDKLSVTSNLRQSGYSRRVGRVIDRDRQGGVGAHGVIRGKNPAPPSASPNEHASLRSALRERAVPGCEGSGGRKRLLLLVRCLLFGYSDLLEHPVPRVPPLHKQATSSVPICVPSRLASARTPWHWLWFCPNN